MALNKTLICTMAAKKLGLDRFTDVESEETDEAILISESYDWCLEYLLRSHLWNFAVARIELAQDTATPAFGFTYQYTLPSDFLRDVRLSAQQVNYKIENGKLLTNESEVFLQYIKRETDPAKFDALFANCLALFIAIENCMALTKDIQLKSSLEASLNRELAKAKRVDALEGSPELINVFGFDDARYSSQSGYYTSSSDIED